MNTKLNMSKLNDSKIINQNNKNEENKKEETQKNEITCIYNKRKDEIYLLHDYTININDWDEEYKKSYIEGKNNINENNINENNINENNIDIYINDKKMKFNYKYKNNEKGNIKVKFIFKKLLTSTSYMFSDCSSLQSINLSSFNTTNVKNMKWMFSYCSSLQSINLSSFNTTNVKDMRYMFWVCSSLKKENVKISNYGKKILDELNKI